MAIGAKPPPSQPSDRAEDGIGPHERGADERELHAGEVELDAEEREERKDGLTDRVVKEADEPEHSDEIPLTAVLHVPSDLAFP